MNKRTKIWIALGSLTVIAAIVGGVIALISRPQPTVAQTDTSPVRQITVVAQGDVATVPDTAIVQIGVQTEADTSQQALSENNTRMNALIAKLKELGVADKDIQTSNLSIYPRYDNDGRAVTGFTANNTVSVKIRDIANAGSLLDQVVQAGANNLGGISFITDDPGPLEQQAREQAIANARSRAESMAQAAGLTVGQVLNITENIGSTPQPMMYRTEAAQDSASVPVQPGEQTITAQVQITFELR